MPWGYSCQTLTIPKALHRLHRQLRQSHQEPQHMDGQSAKVCLITPRYTGEVHVAE